MGEQVVGTGEGETHGASGGNLHRLAGQLEEPEAALLRAALGAVDHGVLEALGESVVGVYLTGSFALGSGDVHSDVDFLVVLTRPLAQPQLDAVRALHRVLPDRPEHWARHLEGSYATLADVAGRAGDGPPWLYVDNGQRELAWSRHDDTEVFRWVLKNRAITVSGPPPDSLLGEVPTKAIRSEASALGASRRADALADLDYLHNGWGQPHEVLTQCRILYTACTGEVIGKADAARWSLGVLPPEWHGLVRAAIASRPDPWGRVHRKADPSLAARTGDFLRFLDARAHDA